MNCKKEPLKKINFLSEQGLIAAALNPAGHQRADYSPAD
tara:strand:- start:56 stop:172 length:117 start_codon:yes stop_codon:yes gene_type:complete